MLETISKKNYTLQLEITDHTAGIGGGSFEDLVLLPDALFTLELEHVTDKTVRPLTSLSAWEKVDLRRYGRVLHLSLRNPEGLGDIMVVLRAAADDTGIDWKMEVISSCPDWSVAKISYPAPKVTAEDLNLFIPDGAGRHIQNAGKNPIDTVYRYLRSEWAMEYSAFWGKTGGIYMGVHDPDAAMKLFHVVTGDDCGKVNPIYYTPGVGRGAYSFGLPGKMRWQAFSGDWYDATRIYADFVYTYANWLPEVDENGRPDTAQRFKEIPFWAVDYIPNSPAQRDARPMVLGTVSQLYPKDYWFEAPILLKEKLGTPMAYHVYNWHEIPFNINYPHYTPAREEFFRGVGKLKEADIMVMPYINSVSWEKHDADEGFEVNYENTGFHGASIIETGKPYQVAYPQKKLDGEKTQLMPMCPDFATWHNIIENEARTIETTMPVDGIYFDEIANHHPHPCRNPEHNHLPGGGSYWSDGYNLMMSKIRMDKPEDAFYFTESHAEAYMKSFDGFLTWLWCAPDQVPAYSLVYAGYIEMLGRFTDGGNREDETYFRFHIASSLLFGQQLGWVNAAVVYNEKRTDFLVKLARIRYANTDLFHKGTVLRPAALKTDLPAAPSADGPMAQLMCQTWQMKDGSRTSMFLVNIAEESADCELSFSLSEYGVDPAALPEGFTANGDTCTAKLTLDALEARVIEFGCKK